MSNRTSRSYDDYTHRFYCINLKEDRERRIRMINRFKHHDLHSYVTFVPAIEADSPLVDYYHKGMKRDMSESRSKRVTACFASHLKAIRAYLEDVESSNTRGTIICEDDILLINEWKDSYKEVMSNIPDQVNVVMLSYMLDDWKDNRWVGIDKRKENLFSIKKPVAWGTQMYWISREAAKHILYKFDRPCMELQRKFSHMVTAEIITLMSKPILAYPVLAIEDCISTSLNSDMLWHCMMFSAWIFNNYSNCMKDPSKSPLNNKTIEEFIREYREKSSSKTIIDKRNSRKDRHYSYSDQASTSAYSENNDRTSDIKVHHKDPKIKDELGDTLIVKKDRR